MVWRGSASMEAVREEPVGNGNRRQINKKKTRGNKGTLCVTEQRVTRPHRPNGNCAALLRIIKRSPPTHGGAQAQREPHLCFGGGAVVAQQRVWATQRPGPPSCRAYLRHAFATTFAMAAKFGVPRPVDASQPLIAAQPSVLPPTAFVPCVTSLNMPGFW